MYVARISFVYMLVEGKKWKDSWAVSGGHIVALRPASTSRKEADFSQRDSEDSFPLGVKLLGKNEEQEISEGSAR